MSGAPRVKFQLHADRHTEPFWRAAAEHRLVIARCATCGAHRMPPAAVCHACRSTEVEWTEPSGEGVVFAFTVIRRDTPPVEKGSSPYVVAVVELPDAGGIRMTTNLVDVEPEDVRIGMPVVLTWDDVEPGIALPRFRPA